MVSDLFAYWDEHPPLHEMAAAYLGIGSKKPTKQDNSGMLGELIATVPGRRAKINA